MPNNLDTGGKILASLSIVAMLWPVYIVGGVIVLIVSGRVDYAISTGVGLIATLFVLAWLFWRD